MNIRLSELEMKSSTMSNWARVVTHPLPVEQSSGAIEDKRKKSDK
jgi:hypothetical protein